jgi:hypothetical protein
MEPCLHDCSTHNDAAFKHSVIKVVKKIPLIRMEWLIEQERAGM